MQLITRLIEILLKLLTAALKGEGGSLVVRAALRVFAFLLVTLFDPADPTLLSSELTLHVL